MSYRKIIYILVALALLIVGAGTVFFFVSQMSPVEADPTPIKTQELAMLPEYIKPAPAEYVKPVMDAIGWSLQRESVRENSGVKYVDFLAVSSGEFYTITVPIDGDPVLDVVMAYMPLKTGVVEIPIAIGITLPDQYIYFYAGRNPDEVISREDALKHAETVLVRGKVFDLLTSKYVSVNGIDREKCIQEKSSQTISTVCELAQEFGRLADPTVERMFISKISTSKNWMPFGWWFHVTMKQSVSLEE